MISRSCLILFFLSMAALAFSQRPKSKLDDSAAAQLRRDSAHIFRPTTWKPYLRLENRNSYISSERVGLPGLMLGATFREKHIFAAGYYSLWNRKFPFSFFVRDIKPDHFLRMHYYNFSYLYILLNKRYLQLNPLVELGYGRFIIEERDEQGNAKSSRAGSLYPFGGGLQVIVKPWRAFGVQAIGGYRFSDSRDEDLNFRGWFYTLGIWIDARHLIRSARYHKAKQKYKR